MVAEVRVPPGEEVAAAAKRLRAMELRTMTVKMMPAVETALTWRNCRSCVGQMLLE
jgi:hypothetical protein